MKKFIYTLAVTLILSFPTLTQAASFTTSPATGTFNKGCNFSVKINIDSGGAKVDSAEATVLFDNGKITPASAAVSQGTIFPTYVPVTTASSGKIVVSGISNPGTPFTGSGLFATLNFTVRSDATTGPFTIKFDFDPNDRAKTTDSNIVETSTIAELLSSVGDGSYNIGTGPNCSGITQPVGGTSSASLVQTQELTPQGVAPGFSLPTIIIASLAISLIFIGAIAAFVI